MVYSAPTDDHSKDKLDIVFSFSIPEEARKQLEQKVLRGEVVDSKELTTVYSPKPEDVKRLTSWLKDQGMEIIRASKDQTSVYARGTVAQFTKSLQVEMVRMTKNGTTYNAARNFPSLPNNVAQVFKR